MDGVPIEDFFENPPIYGPDTSPFTVEWTSPHETFVDFPTIKKSLLEDPKGWLEAASNHPIARKGIRLAPSHDDPRSYEEKKKGFLAELRILRHAQHPHVIKILYAYIFDGLSDQKYAAIVMMRGKTFPESFSTWKPEKMYQAMECLAGALDYLHAIGIRHRDIKPQNILFDNKKPYFPYFADFGISRMALIKTLSTTKPFAEKGRTAQFCAPEVEDGGSRGRSADVFSLATVFVEMLAAYYSGEAKNKLHQKLRTGGQEASYAKNLDQVHDLIRAWQDSHAKKWSVIAAILPVFQDMLDDDPNKRPNTAKLVKSLSEKRPNWPESPCDCRKFPDTPEGKLLEYCRKGDVKALSEIRQLKEIKGAIHLASTLGHVDVVKYLLEQGFNVNLQDYSGQTSLHCAAGDGQKDVISCLLNHSPSANPANAKLEDSDRLLPLHCAASHGNKIIISQLVQRYKEGVRAQDHSGRTPLHYAASRGNLDAVKMLVLADESTSNSSTKKKEKLVNMCDNTDRTALHLAAQFGSLDVVEYLVCKKASVKKVATYEGKKWAALHFAVYGIRKGGQYDQVASFLWEKTKDSPRIWMDINCKATPCCCTSERARKICKEGGDSESEHSPSQPSHSRTDAAAPPSESLDLAGFLAVVQSCNVDLLPITWQPQLGQLGAGASGVVHQALVNVQTSFAFKLYADSGPLPPEARPTALRGALHEFANEIRVLTKPWVRREKCVANLLGVGWEAKYDDGVLWPVLVFEKAHWGNLRQFIESEEGKKLSFDDKLNICRDCVSATLKIHEHDIIHGDIKPDNILIFNQGSDKGPDERFTAKIIDFCFSHIGDSDTEEVSLPRSPPWEAPEYSKKRIPIGDAKKADIYSLGLVCFWLVFRDNLLSYWAHHSSDHGNAAYPDLRRPDEKSIYKLKVENGLHDFVEQYLAHYRNTAPESQLVRLEKFWSLSLNRNQTERTSNLLVLLGLISNIEPSEKHPVFSDFDLKRIFSSTPYGDEPVRAYKQFQLTTKENSAGLRPSSPFDSWISKSLYQLTQVDYRLRRQLVTSWETRLATGQRDDTYQLALCKAIGFGTGKDPRKSDELVFGSSRPIIDLEQDIKKIRYGRIEPEFQEAFMRFFDSGNVAWSNVGEAHVRDEANNVKVAYEMEIEDLENTLGSSCELVMLLKQRLAGIITQLGELDQAGRLYLEIEKGIAERKDTSPDMPQAYFANKFMEENSRQYELDKAKKENNRRLLNSRGELAASYRSRGYWIKANWLERDILDKKKDLLGNKHLETIETMESLAMTLVKQKRWREAESLELVVLETRRSQQGPDHPRTLRSEKNLAAIYGCVQTCREVEREVVIPAGARTAAIPSKKKVTAAERGQRRWKMAEELLGCVLKRGSRVLQRNDPDMADARAVLAAVYHRQRRWDEAAQLENEVLELRTSQLDGDHPDILASLGNLALLLKMQGPDCAKLAEAEAKERHVLEARRRVLGPLHRDTLMALANLAATCNMRCGEEEEDRAAEVSKLRAELQKLTREARRARKDEWKQRRKNERRQERRQKLKQNLERIWPGTVVSAAESQAKAEVDAWYKTTFGA